MPAIIYLQATLFFILGNMYFRKKENAMKYLIPFLILFLTNACTSDHRASLSGEIKGLQSDTVLFYGADQFYPHIDTIVTQKGKFKIYLPIDTLTTGYLYIRSLSKELPIYIDKTDQIKLIIDTLPDLSSTTVTGNTHSQELYEFLNATQSDHDTLRRQKAGQFIIRHPYSFANLYLLDHFFVQQANPDYTIIDSLIQKMGGTLQDTPYIQRIASFVKQNQTITPGKAFPYFNLPSTLNRKITRMNTFRDHVLIIHLWASWYPESRDMNRQLRKLYNKFHSKKNFDMLGISFDTDKQIWKNSIQADSIVWPQAYVPDGLTDKAKELYAIESLPAVFLLDKSGRIKLRSENLQELTDSLSAMLN